MNSSTVASGARSFVALRRHQSSAMRPAARRSLAAKAMQQPSPEQLKQMQEAYQQAMSDPEQRKQMEQMQEAMKNPQMQQQMASVMQDQSLQEKMKQMKDDPEFADKFAEAEKEGMTGLMKLMQDEEFLRAISKKLGGPQNSPVAVPGAAAAAPEEVVVDNLLDAAKVGDLEAIEDFIAIGKDVNMADAEKRTPLHYATAHEQPQAISMLVEAGANLESTDSKNNTPLHYAAGYGRVNECRLLLNLGASPAAKNGTGKTPLDLASLNEQNPINAEEELMTKLQVSA